MIAGSVGASVACASRGRSWRAGVATVDITPAAGIWMAGYAARTQASQGVALPLFAKALALEDADGVRAVLVTADILGFTDGIAERVADAVERRHGLGRAHLLLNASHTHCGPVVDGMLSVAYDLTAEQRDTIHTYSRDLETKVIAVIGDALARLQPASLSVGEGRAAFAANRRVDFTPKGPVDHAVPVARVGGPDDETLAIVFGYACHNTTLGADFVRFHGDYAGVAQAALERRYPGARALFVTGCGGDANPKPRGTLELAEQHGRALADVVANTLTTTTPVSGPLRAAYDTVALPFAETPGSDVWQSKLQDPDQYVRRHANLMLAQLRSGRPLPAVQPEPVQIWRFGGDLTVVALGGEVVVDYVLRLKKTYPNERMWVAGYSNDVFAYVPSRRVLEEGGYEGGGAMIYYGKPSAFAPSVEERIHDKVNDLMRTVTQAVE
ncbi:MAG: neutral/alkaline non-lysosomal ceramidase N-terminal domain-containing protein [Vicinamibacteraceae bacterium]